MLVAGAVPPRHPGRRLGELVTFLPGAAVFDHQQLPVLSGKESHQKSRPFGLTSPPGLTPIWLWWRRLSNDVDTLSGSHPGTGVELPTGGGPAGATKTILLYIYDKAFRNSLGGDYGEATAVSVLLAIVLAILSWLYFKLTNRWSTS